MTTDVLVYGAYGHTGRFVVAELVRRGLVPVLSGRDAMALEALGCSWPDAEVRPAAVEDQPALEAAARDVAAVVNCAGPFLDTALPVARAAVHAGAHYLDVSAEQASVQELYRAHEAPGSRSGVAVLPAMGFYGGLADLLVAATVADWDAVDEVVIAVGLDRWWPTGGTRSTGRRNTAPRLVLQSGRLVPVASAPHQRAWDFPEPLGPQTVVNCPFTEMVTLARHLRAGSVQTYLATGALDDLRDPTTPAPTATDELGRSAQRFVVDVTARRGRQERRTRAIGRDIYAVTAPLVVEALQRLLDGRATVQGATAPAQAFDPVDFLTALSPGHLDLRGL